MLSCSDLTMRSSAVGAFLRRREVLAEFGEPRRELLLVHRLQKAIERGLRDEQTQKQPQQPVEPRRPDVLGAAGLIAGGAAHAGRDAPHLEAARVQPLEARARARGQPFEHRDQRHRQAATRPASAAAALPARRGPWRRSPRGTAAPTRAR